MNFRGIKNLYGSNIVPGEGPLPCDLFLIGEAPGEQEDLQGKPFVGRCGQLLNKILKTIGRPRETVRITNAVKQRPPSNRTPTFEEIQAHRPFLLDEIFECKPRCVVLMGKSAAQAFLNQENVGPIWKLRKALMFKGTFNNRTQTRLIFTYHPAAGLRTSTYAEDLKKDLKRAIRFIKGN